MNQIFIKILESPDFKNAAVVLISELCKDPEVLKVAVELTMNVLSKPEVFNVKKKKKIQIYFLLTISLLFLVNNSFASDFIFEST